MLNFSYFFGVSAESLKNVKNGLKNDLLYLEKLK